MPDAVTDRGGRLEVRVEIDAVDGFVRVSQDAAEMLGALLELGGHPVKLAFDGTAAISDIAALTRTLAAVAGR